MEIIGSDKIGFISKAKHGSSTLETLIRGYDFINQTNESVNEAKIGRYQSEKIILFPWRDEFESLKSGFFEDTTQLLSSDKTPLDTLRNIFNKKNNSNVLTVNNERGNSGHKHILSNVDFLEFLLIGYDKFYFFDLKHLSNPKLIEWISEHDPQWKNVSIPHRNSSLTDPIKIKIKNILPQIKEELGEDYLDYNNINNWPRFKHYYEFSKMFFKSHKKSKQFLDFDKMEAKI